MTQVRKIHHFFILFILVFLSASARSSGYDEISLVFVGDVYLSPSITGKVKSPGNENAFSSVAPFLRNASIMFGNLECTLSTNGKITKSRANIKAGKDFILYCPSSSVDTLKLLGFDIVSLANNHVTDYGKSGLLDTLFLLDKAGIKTVGAGKNIASASELKIVDVNEAKIGFLAYSGILPPLSDADENHPGVNPGRGWSKKYPDSGIKKIIGGTIKSAKEKADFLIVSVHWGTEHTYELNSMQRTLGRFFIDSGADMVIGHHPHILQGIETYKEKLIFYSLGNFIFEGRGGTAQA